MRPLLVDADVLIDMTRGHPQAIHFIKTNLDRISISVVTIAELYAGARRDKEEGDISILCDAFGKFTVDEDIARRAGRLRNRYGRSHGTGTIDCIVAATAELQELTLVTLNRKHYPMIKNILIPYKKH